MFKERILLVRSGDRHWFSRRRRQQSAGRPVREEAGLDMFDPLARRPNPVVWGLLLFLLVLLSACQPDPSAGSPTLNPAFLTPPPSPPVTPLAGSTRQIPATSTPFIPPTEAPATASAAMWTVHVSENVPDDLAGEISVSLENESEPFAMAEEVTSDSQRSLTVAAGTGEPFAAWIYAIAAAFPTVEDELTLDEIRAGWAGESTVAGRLLLDRSTAATWSAVWGPPSADILQVAAGELQDALWTHRPAWTIIPFHRLRPELKVLAVNGQSPLLHDFQPGIYPLTIRFGLSGDAQGVSRFLAGWRGPTTNRHPDRLTRVAMSGVTALGRATAHQMELRGVTVPGLDVAPVMTSADITHISHEVAFAPDCPFPSPVGDPVFCARESYMALIESLGTDVVELTGNHLNDWGADNLVYTVELYESRGMKSYGGGRDLEQAKEPALFEHNGNKIAFVGCNPVGPAHAWATDDRAGSLPCDYQALFDQISALREDGYLVIATLQYAEFYHYAATGQQQADFRALVDAGAAAVSGSQGHHAQGFDFHAGAYIHFGLGNLFFDQMQMLGTRQSFIDTYVIYKGRLLSVELFTSLIEDFCCPRLMTELERTQLLQAVFQASGW